jgi:hypothetical protein
LFRTYHVRELASINCKIWEAARATTAAPTFFKRIAIGEAGHVKEYFVDAALGCNNPANYVLDEARTVFGPEKAVGCLVSIGTGHRGTIGLGGAGTVQNLLPTKLIKVLKDITTDCESTAHRLSLRFRDIPSFYFRFSVVHGSQGISLDEWERMGELTQHTQAYMTDTAVSKAIDEVVDILLCKPGLRSATLGDICQ